MSLSYFDYIQSLPQLAAPTAPVFIPNCASLVLWAWRGVCILLVAVVRDMTLYSLVQPCSARWLRCMLCCDVTMTCLFRDLDPDSFFWTMIRFVLFLSVSWSIHPLDVWNNQHKYKVIQIVVCCIIYYFWRSYNTIGLINYALLSTPTTLWAYRAVARAPAAQAC